jgi:uncharacterized membrane protein
MSIALWIVAGFVAAVFLAAGGMKIAFGDGVVEKNMTSVRGWSSPQVRLLGAVEVLGALGLILPAVSGIATWLVPVSVIGLGILMVGAVAAHVKLKEPVVPPVAVGALALFVAVGRIWIAPFAG